MKILVYISGLTGVSLHRQLLPYQDLLDRYDDVQVSWLPQTENINADNIAAAAEGFDLLVFSRMMPPGYIEALKGRITLVNDTDDFWVLDRSHPLWDSYRAHGTTESLERHIRMADCVTTTTELLAGRIRGLNPNVTIFPNALDPVGQFAPKTKPSKRIRFGIIGSSSHTYDMRLLEGVNQWLSDEDRDRMQWVLCGFDRGMTNFFDKDGRYMGTRQTPWDGVCWTWWEKVLTDGYRLLGPGHRDFLLQYREGQDDYEGGYYRRLWTRPVDTYATFYDDIDVLVTPLQPTVFNRYKSPLKMVEAGVKGKGLIISDVDPYTDYIVSVLEDPDNGNCIPVRSGKGGKGFAKAVKRILNDPSLIDRMAGNLNALVADRFSLKKITDERHVWLNSLSL